MPLSPHGAGFFRDFWTDVTIKWKRVKHAKNVAVWISPNIPVCNLFYWLFSPSLLNAHKPNSYTSNYNFYTSRSTVHTLQTVYLTNGLQYAPNEKTQSVGVCIDAVEVLWVGGLCEDFHRFLCGCGMGMEIEIQSARQSSVTDILSQFYHSTAVNWQMQQCAGMIL